MTDILARIEAEIEPRLDKRPEDGGYDCCGCSIYEKIVDDIKEIVRESPPPQLGIIGREDALNERVTKTLHETGGRIADYSPIREHFVGNVKRGRSFDLDMGDGIIMRVTVTLEGSP